MDKKNNYQKGPPRQPGQEAPYKRQYDRRPNTQRSRDPGAPRQYGRDGSPPVRMRSNPNQPGTIRQHMKIRVEENVDDIKADIIRLEKEIELEIKEIKGLGLGL